MGISPKWKILAANAALSLLNLACYLLDRQMAAQAAAFEAAQLGVACREVDRAARRVLAAGGLSGGYELPGLPDLKGPQAAQQVQLLPTVDAATHTAQLRVALPAQLKGAAPGMFARVRLILSERPLNAEEIADKLGMARSNVSNSLKELLTWKLIHRVPLLGDRRDFFAAETDMWQMANKVALGRKEREIDPMLAAIDAAMAQADQGGALHPVVRQRLGDMHGFIHTVEGWYRQMLGVPPAQIMRLIKLGSKVVGLLRFVGGKGNDSSE